MIGNKSFQIISSGLKFPKDKKHIIGIIKPDTHTAPIKDNQGGKSASAWSCFLQAIKIISPDFIVDIGDAGEWTSVNHYIWAKSKKPPAKYICDAIEEEAKSISKDFDELEMVLPNSCQKFFIQGNHDCLDDQTEALTKRGWKRYYDIQKDDLVLGLTQSGCAEWQAINNIIIKDFDGKLNTFDNRFMSLSCTDNHRVLYKKRLYKDGWSEFTYDKFIQLPNARISFPMSGRSLEKGYQISDKLLALLGWILTDGHIGKNNVSIYQAESKKDLVKNVLDSAGISYTIRSRQRNISEICGVKLKKRPQREYIFNITAKASRELLDLFNINKQKDLPVWSSQLSDRQFEILLNSLIDGDESRRKHSPTLVLYGKKRFLDQVQGLCISKGWSCSMTTYRQIQYRLNINKRAECQMDFSHKNIEKRSYNGSIWCLNTPLSNFAVRRNGKSYFIGNCWLDNFTDELPHLKKTFNIPDLINLNKYGWKYFEHGRWVKFGKIYLNHGTAAKGANHLRNMVLRHGANIMYGHIHDMGSAAIGSLGGIHKAFSVGCLANMDKPFLRGDMTNWEHGFCILDLKSNGNFQVQQIPIYAGECLVYGKLIKSKVK